MLVKIDKIKTNPKNPRLIKDEKYEQLKKSIKEFPQMLKLREIIVDENMVILGGNMRYKACKELGIKEVEIKIAENLTEEQKKEFIVKDNVGYGEWNWDMIANEWDADQVTGWGLDLLVSTEQDIDFDNIKSTEDRKKEFKEQLVTCPHCEGKFNIQV